MDSSGSGETEALSLREGKPFYAKSWTTYDIVYMESCYNSYSCLLLNISRCSSKHHRDQLQATVKSSCGAYVDFLYFHIS